MTQPLILRAPSAAWERSLALLALVASEGRVLTLAEIASQLDLPKATAYRLCNQLQGGGWLARDVDERSFSVGPALRRVALNTLNNGVLRGLRHAVLEDLVEQVGETCNFTALDGAKVIYLDRVEAPSPWRLTLDVGAHVPLHCTASGKLFLAMQPATQRNALIDGLVLDAMTPATITSPSALRAECALIAERGYSTDREEFITGLNAIAVPVCDAGGRTRAAIAIHGTSTRMTLETAHVQLSSLQAAASRMAALI